MSAARDATDLVGRAAEVAQLRSALDAVGAGTTRFLELTGEPGIGKTRLLDTLAAEADDRGHLVLAGRAAEFERDMPFGVLVDALDEYLASLDARRLDAMGLDRAAELGAVFPSLRAVGREPAAVQAERYRTHRAVRDLLERLAATRPLVLILDDMHWADPAAVELVAHLARRPPEAPVLVALAQRRGQTPPPLAAALGAAGREGTVTSVAVGPLGRDDALGLLGADLQRTAGDALYRESGGNPFYLEQLARATRRGRAPATGAGGRGREGEAPPAVMAALLDELATLSPDARAVLDGAAVAGEPFELELAATAAELDEERVLDALDELLALGLVRPTDVPRRFVFRHPLVLQAVYGSTRGGWRLGAHGRIAAELADRRADASVRAHHVEQCARTGDEEAIAVLRAAGTDASARAPVTAARWLAAALRLLPERDDDRRLGLLVPLANALRDAGELEASRTALIEALALLPPEATARRVELVTECAAVEHWMSLHDEARARLTNALEELPDPDSPEGVALVIEHAVDAFYAMEFDALRSHGRRALDVAETLGDARLVGAAAAVMSLGEAAAGRHEEATRFCALAAGQLDVLDDADLVDRLDALFYLGWAEVYAVSCEDAIRHFSRGVTVARASGRGRLIVPMLLSQSEACSQLGRLAESIELTETAVEAGRLSPNPHDIFWALWARSWIALLAGDLDTALQAGGESMELDPGLSVSLYFIAEPAWTYGAALVEAGEVARGAELVVASIAGEQLDRVMPNDRCMAIEAAVTAELARGRADAARAWADRGDAIASELGIGFALAHAHTGRAAVTLAEGNPAAAAERAIEAANIGRECGSHLLAARARLLAGKALAAAEQRERAIAELRTAETELGAFGAQRWRADAERELRRLGQRVRRRARTTVSKGDGIAALSERELEVARLVADRRTNRQIAAALFLSEKTVESHMRNLFDKLGVSSRVGVARTIDDAGRTG